MGVIIAVSVIYSVITIAIFIYFFAVLCDIRDTLHDIRDASSPSDKKKGAVYIMKNSPYMKINFLKRLAQSVETDTILIIPNVPIANINMKNNGKWLISEL